MNVYTVKEVAHMMKVSRDTIQREIARKRIQAFRVGKQVRIAQSQVDKMMMQQNAPERMVRKKR